MDATLGTTTESSTTVDRQRTRAWRWAWIGALACFVIAAATGAWYRFAMLYGATGGLSLTGIRHAHSHLMYFGWATPALFALMAWYVGRVTGRLPGRTVMWIIGATFAMALLAYPSFLLFGYSPVEIGATRLPLSVIAASFNMVVWYVFVGWYLRRTRGVVRTRALMLFDLSLAFLVLATLGAWGLALLQPLGIEDPVWTSALTHLFLDLFSEGWFVLGVLGLAYAGRGSAHGDGSHWSLWLVAGGLPFTYAMGMPDSLVSPLMQSLARAGSTAVAIGLAVLLWPIARGLFGEREHLQRWLWGVPLVLLAFKLFAQLVVSVTPSLWWADLHGVRILYLHVMLLGFVSLGLVAAAGTSWGREVIPGWPLFFGAVLLVLLSLVPLSGLWPAGWGGGWTYDAATWIATLPAAVAVLVAARAVIRQRGFARTNKFV